MNKQFKYYAFISYCHKDEKYAKWLQNKLESYNLPTQIKHDNPNLRKGIRPIFRDQTDLGVGVLYDNIKEELAASKALIVICSPLSAKSEWVGKEIKEFLTTHEANDIIPFIVEGTPHSKVGKKCFNPVIEEITPSLLGVNINEIGRQQALTKVVAKLLNIKYDALWQRHLRKEKQRKLLLGLLALFFILLGVFAWDCTRSRYEYYADYVDCYGIPKGVIALNKEEVSHRYRMWRFEYKRQLNLDNFRQWRLSEVAYVNSAGTIQDITDSELKDRFPIQKLQFGQSGNLIGIEYCNSKEKTLLRHEISSRDNVPACIVDFKSSVEGQGSGFLGAVTTSSSMSLMEDNNQKSNIIRYAYQRDEKGYITRKTYHANNAYDLRSSAVYDADGIAGISYERDSLGRVTKMRYIDADYNNCSTKKGIAGRKYEYDKYGNIYKATYFDNNGKPVLNELGWAKSESIADKYGNIIESSYFAADEFSLCIDRLTKLTSKYDERGNMIETAFFDKNGLPCINNIGIAKWTSKYDERGNRIETSYFGTDGLPCLSNEGLAKWTAKYDERGNRIETSFFGTDGLPCLSNERLAKWTSKYDERGNRIETSFFGTDGLPCLHKDGNAKWTAKYDERGNRIEQSYFGTDGLPCLINNNYAKWTARYDERGNRTEESYFGTDGLPCISVEGIAKWTGKYDERGNKFETSSFGTDGLPCTNNYGYAKRTTKYDERGNRTEESYFGTDGLPCLSVEGIAKWTGKYDERGNRTEESYFGTDGLPCLSNDGYAKWTAKYDERGNEIETAFFGTDESPCLSNYGCAKWTAKYDERGNRTEESYFGTDGLPCLSNEGLAKWTAKYDERGNRTEGSSFGTDGLPCLSNDGNAKWTAKYDERGNCIETSYFGADGLPCLHKGGYAKWTAKYDKRGFRIDISYFDAEGSAISDNERPLVLATVDFPGLFKDEGLSGDFIILEWNEWNLYNSIQEWESAFQKSKTQSRTLLMVPIFDNSLGDVIRKEFPAGTLGVRLRDFTSISLYKDCVDAYEKYKQEQQ